jgi:hypothetical protein
MAGESFRHRPVTAPEAIGKKVLARVRTPARSSGPTTIGQKERGKLCWIPTKQLFVPEEYQRNLIEDHARRISKEFDWRVFGAIVVSDRGNKSYAIVDGQNRCRAAEMRGISEVPCVVHHFASVIDEAAVFDKLNAVRRPVLVAGRQKSELFQGNPVAIAAHQFTKALGEITVPLSTVRQMSTRFCPELRRLTPLIVEMIALSTTPMRQHFLEAICVLEAMLGESDSLTTTWRSRVLLTGYDDCLAGMADYEKKIGGFGCGLRSLKTKADALLWALNTRITIEQGRNPHRHPRVIKVGSHRWNEAEATVVDNRDE